MQGSSRESRKTRRRKGRDFVMAQINNKAVRTITKLVEAGFDSEKAVLAMTIDDMLALPNVSVAEIGMVNEIQKVVKTNKLFTFLGGGEI